VTYVVDWPKLAEALDMACEIRNMTLRDVADELRIAPSGLTRMRQGKHLSTDAVAGLVAWLYPQRIPIWIKGGAVRCCDLHNARCEPPSELCCGDCSEATHPNHPPDTPCVLRAHAREDPITDPSTTDIDPYRRIEQQPDGNLTAADAAADRCYLTDLLITQCGHCKGLQTVEQQASNELRPGPPFTSRYDGTCSSCGIEFWPGEMIRADGAGGWLAECCS
jgi:hypothetical protein